jgi:hypothetical protein
MRETVVAGGTAIFDTLERWREKGGESFGAAMELLDAGFRNGGEVTKMVLDAKGEWRLEVFPVYAPYMFAAIDRKSVTETALDRSFEIAMMRKNTRIRTAPYDARCEVRCGPLREQLYRWGLSNANRVADLYGSAGLQDRVDALGLNDRAVDVWKPLLAVVGVLAEGEVDQLTTLARDMSPDPDRQEEQRQLSIASGLRTLAGPEGTVADTTQRLIEQLRTVTGMDAPDLHGVLTAWGFSERSTRLAGFDTPRRAWEVSEAQLAEVEAKLREGGLPS